MRASVAVPLSSVCMALASAGSSATTSSSYSLSNEFSGETFFDGFNFAVRFGLVGLVGRLVARAGGWVGRRLGGPSLVDPSSESPAPPSVTTSEPTTLATL